MTLCRKANSGAKSCVDVVHVEKTGVKQSDEQYLLVIKKTNSLFHMCLCQPLFTKVASPEPGGDKNPLRSMRRRTVTQ